MKRKVAITHADKLWFPKAQLTKGDVINYYESVASKMLPFLKERPLVMQRFPEGIKNEGFYHKNVPDSFPDWIPTVVVDKREGGHSRLVLCNSRDVLLYLVNFGCLTPHIWLSAEKNLEKPDKLIFDIDPPKGKITEAKKVASLLREVLEKCYRLKSFVMTTGSRGYHVVVPIKATHPFDVVRDLAKEIAALVVAESPRLCTMEVRKAARRGRVYIDIMRNAYAQHGVAPYAVRALPAAPLAMPISWDELQDTDPQSFTLLNYKPSERNPWQDFAHAAKKLF